jgi:isopenicillin N synthase-like dioxygenase
MKVKTVSWRSSRLAEDFAQSICETGFAVIADHPISFQLIQDSFAEWARFFSSEEKHKYKFDPKKQAGYFPFKSENAKDYKHKDLKEFFHHFDWSEMPSSCLKFTPKLRAELEEMGYELLKGLNRVTPAEVRKKYSMPLHEMIKDSDGTLLRPIHYPPLSGTEEEGAVRAAAHEDINLITLLPASTAPGLQVKDVAGKWHDVSCDPGTIAVNAGDMLQEASGGYYPSTTHQVVNPHGPESRKPRYSMPLFVHPRRDVILSERYTADGYLKQRLRELGLL